MSFITAIGWFFNFVISITFPAMLGTYKPQGAFAWYAAWKWVPSAFLILNPFWMYNIMTYADLYSIPDCSVIGWVLVLFFVPETKALSLEDFDQVFSVPTKIHATYQARTLHRNIKKYIFGPYTNTKNPFQGLLWVSMLPNSCVFKIRFNLLVLCAPFGCWLILWIHLWW